MLSGALLDGLDVVGWAEVVLAVDVPLPRWMVFRATDVLHLDR
jgi:hypothetical protein